VNFDKIIDFELNIEKKLSKFSIASGVDTWHHLVELVSSLPYGRNENRYDLSLVLTEQKGTCSSKHAFLREIAIENNQENIKLILGLYKMDNQNTPRIGDELVKNSIDFIPEAHCYLKIGDERVDITTESSSFTKIEKSLIKEIEIQPNQVSEFKVNYHKNYLKDWISENNISYNFNELWAIREKCIKNIENSN
jgi:hypothetical protein